MIFISYSRGDSSFAFQLANDLYADHFPVWIDQGALRGDSNWSNEVEQAIDKSLLVLVILSERSIASASVSNEIALSLDERKPVIPVMHQICKVPLRLRTLHYIDFTRNYCDALSNMK